MSKKNPKTFKYTPTERLPKLAKIKTEWDLKRHFYASEKDPQIEKDVRKAERAYEAFAKKYRTKDFTKTAKSLLAALKDNERLEKIPGHRPLYYLFCRRELNAVDKAAEQKLNLLEQRLTKAGNVLIFFDVALKRIPKKRQQAYLKDPKLSRYHFLLEGAFKSAPYTKSEAEERILSLKSMTSRGMWVSGTEKILNQKSVMHRGEEVPINGALMKYMHLPRKVRHALWQKCAAVLKEIAPIAENELTAVITDKKINDEIRGYEKPYSSTALAYDHSEKSIEALVSAVTEKGYPLSQRFYKLKSKLLGYKLSFVDRAEQLGSLPAFPLHTSVEICRDAFYGLADQYGRIFDEMLENGRIDAYPKKGKGGGAFCLSGTSIPTMVFLNQNDDLNSLRVIAHEMGHAIHAERSKKLPIMYQGHSVATAETASTFFEGLVAKKMIDATSGKQKAILLESYISDKLLTTVMCIARFNFELEMHERIRTEGSMTWQDMAALHTKHMRRYCGPSVSFTEDDGLHFVYKPHYRMNFYQYSYSFGDIASSIMRKNLDADPRFKKNVDAFLCAGETDTVDNIFASIGINMADTKTFDEGLSMLKADIDELERITK